MNLREISGRYGNSDLAEDKVISQLYSDLYPPIKNYVLKNNGTDEDAKDLFQDGILVVLNIIRKNESLIDKNLGLFLFKVCKFKWLNELKKKKTRIGNFYLSVNDLELVSDKITSEESIENQKLRLFDRHFCKLSPSRRLILALYFIGIPIPGIMSITGINSEEYARRKIYLSKKDLISRISNDPEFIKIQKHIRIPGF